MTTKSKFWYFLIAQHVTLDTEIEATKIIWKDRFQICLLPDATLHEYIDQSIINMIQSMIFIQLMSYLPRQM